MNCIDLKDERKERKCFGINRHTHHHIFFFSHLMPILQCRWIFWFFFSLQIYVAYINIRKERWGWRKTRTKCICCIQDLRKKKRLYIWWWYILRGAIRNKKKGETNTSLEFENRMMMKHRNCLSAILFLYIYMTGRVTSSSSSSSVCTLKRKKQNKLGTSFFWFLSSFYVNHKQNVIEKTPIYI